MTCPTPTKHFRNAKLMLLLASATNRKHNIFSVIITFFTILRSAWLLHPSQQVQTLIPTKTTTSLFLPLSITMARAKTTVIKDTSTKDNKDSKHQKNLTTGSASTRSKAKGSAQMNPQPKNVKLAPPPPPFHL